MWEHAGALIGIPKAIKATIDIFEYLKSGRTTAQQAASDATSQLNGIKVALEQFAEDAMELVAYKQLHTMTNTFMIDLRESFTIAGPDVKRARAHHSDSLEAIEQEFISVWEGQRGGAQLARLRTTPSTMEFLRSMPSDVMERIKQPPWEDYMWKILHKAKDECGNFNNFSKVIKEFRTINVALNNYADRNIADGIDKFNDVMDDLRHSLGRS
jgi:hypothetical protein